MADSINALVDFDRVSPSACVISRTGEPILTEFLLWSFTTVCTQMYTQVTRRRARFSAAS